MATTTNGYVFFLRNSSSTAPNGGVNKDGLGYTAGALATGSENSSTVLASGSPYFVNQGAFSSLAIDPSAQSYFFVDQQGVTPTSTGAVSSISNRPSIRSASTATGAINANFIYSGPAYTASGDYGSINDLAVDQANRRIYFTQSYVTGIVDDGTSRLGKPDASKSGLFWINEAGGTATRVGAVGGLTSPTVLALDLADNIAFVADVTGVGLDGGTTLYGAGNPVNRLTAVNLTTGAVQVLFTYAYRPDQTFGTDYYGGNVLDGLAVDSATHTLYYTVNNLYNPLYNDSYGDTQDGVYKVGFSVSGGSVTLGTTTTLYSGANAFDPSRIEIDTQNGVFYVVGNTQAYNAALGGPGPSDEAIYVGSLTANNTTALTRVTSASETNGAYFGTAIQNPYYADNASFGLDVVPLLGAGSTVSYVAGSATPVATAPALTTSSVSSLYYVGATVTLTGYVAGDLLAATTSGTSVSVSYGGNVLTLSGKDTVANYQSVLRTVTYRSTASDPTGAGASTSRTLTYTVNDGIAAASATSTVAEQTAPIVNAGSPSVTFVGGTGGGVLVDPVLTVTDYTSASLVGATVRISSGFVSGDTLNFAGQNGITGVYTSGTGVLTLSGSATVAQYQTAIRSVAFTFSPGNGNPTAGYNFSRTVSYTATDGNLTSGAVTSTITVVHTPPSVTAGTSATLIRGNGSVVVAPSATVTAPDSNGNIELATVTISAFEPGDTLTTTAASGITVSYTSNQLTLYGTATAAQYQAALDAVTFTTGNASATGTRLLSYVVYDGTTNSSTATSTVTVVAPTPTIGGTAPGQTVGDNAVLTPFSGASVTDAAGEGETLTLTLKAGGTASDANGTLSGTGLTRTGTGTYTLTATTPANLTALLKALVFTPTAHQVAPGSSVTTAIALSLTDAGGGTASDAATTVVATAVNTVPTITGTTAGQAVTDNATLSPFAAATVTDPDLYAGETVTVTVTANGTASDANGILSGTGLVKIGTGFYSVAASTPAAVTAVLRALVFTPTAHQVAPGASVTTGFTLYASDGTAASTNAATTVVATAVNNVPTFAGTTAGQAVGDNTTLSPFAAATVTDPDVNASETVTITVTANGTASDANGLLSGTGLAKIGTGTYALTAGTPAAVTAALRALVFTPTAHQVAPGSTVTTGFTLSDTDGTATASNTATTVVATAVKTAPTITGTVAGQAVTDNATLTPFAAATVTDPDVGASENLTITLRSGSTTTDANGILSGTGLTKTGRGTYALTAGTPSAVTAALRALVFTPTAHQVAPGSSVTTGFTLSDTDGTATASNAATTVVATAAASTPTIAGSTAGQATTDIQPVQPFSGVTISDPDFGATPTVTITLRSNGAATDANGTLSGTGLTRTGVGTYALAAASPATLTSEIRALTFTPTQDQVPVGQSVSTAFDILAAFAGASATDTTTSVQATDVPCYCRGTLVLTDRGDVAVENLVIGDRLVTVSGERRRLRWIGTRSYAGRFLAGRRTLLPVLFRAGSLGEGIPRRDLVVSPLHAMFLEGVLIPAIALVDGDNVVQLTAAKQVEYFHLELDSHDVIWAEGAASETYLDDDNRGMFHNAAEYGTLYQGAPQQAARYCAPRVEDGPVLAKIRRGIATRSRLAAAS